MIQSPKPAPAGFDCAPPGWPGTPEKTERNAALVARRKAGARQLDLSREFRLCEARVRQILANAIKHGLLALPLLALAVAPARAHEWYSGLQRNDGHGSCCSGQDCAPTSMCTLPGGTEGIVVAHQCSPIPWDKVLPGVASPDGGPHLCAIGATVLCVILAGAA